MDCQFPFFFPLGLGRELVVLDDKALVGALAESPCVGGDGKGELAAVHGGDPRLGPCLSLRGRGVVAHVQPGATVPCPSSGEAWVASTAAPEHLGSSEHGRHRTAHGGGVF